MIKVASYNIRKGVGTDRARRPDRIVEVLKEIDADVIALQEVDLRFGSRAAVVTPALLDRHSPWKAIPFGARAASIGWHGNTILVRKAAQIVDCEAIHLPTLEPRGAVMADVRIDGQVLRFVGMHLDLSGLWRRRQAQAIVAHVESSVRQYPTIMMGDLNEWRRASGALNEFGRQFSFAETGPSFHAQRPLGRLDRIMVSQELRIAGCGVHHSKTARMASDHLPIWAVVEGVE